MSGVIWSVERSRCGAFLLFFFFFFFFRSLASSSLKLSVWHTLPLRHVMFHAISVFWGKGLPRESVWLMWNQMANKCWNLEPQTASNQNVFVAYVCFAWFSPCWELSVPVCVFLCVPACNSVLRSPFVITGYPSQWIEQEGPVERWRSSADSCDSLRRLQSDPFDVHESRHERGSWPS